jgi:hypothetical protein
MSTEITPEELVQRRYLRNRFTSLRDRLYELQNHPIVESNPTKRSQVILGIAFVESCIEAIDDAVDLTNAWQDVDLVAGFCENMRLLLTLEARDREGGRLPQSPAGK